MIDGDGHAQWLEEFIKVLFLQSSVTASTISNTLVGKNCRNITAAPEIYF